MKEKNKKEVTIEETGRSTLSGPKRERKGEKPNIVTAYFLRLFGKYDIRDEKQFSYFFKWLVYIVLLLVEGLIILKFCNEITTKKDFLRFFIFLGVAAVLTASEALKFFAVKSNRSKIIFYIIDALAACCFLYFTSGTYSLIVYMLVLTEFYISAERSRLSMLIFFVSMPIYALCYALRMHFTGLWELEAMNIFQDSLSAGVGLSVHFIVVQVALAFYRQFLRLDRALMELDASKKELERAYEVVAEVSALEERQRIAKDIHDTAGHSLTTVIMQTESAKLMLETNPEEAKSKIVAANLQARHALEELRDSVHVLSGKKAGPTLKESLLGIIHESTDGTGIAIRSEVGEAMVSQAKHRFICNTLKEGISNGLRHGGATAFWFEFKQENGRLEFLLSDNGKGVELEFLETGFGLSTMQERAKELGGTVTFHSEEDEGFEIHLSLPADTED